MLAYIAPSLPYAAFLFPADAPGALLTVEGAPWPATIQPARLARRADDPRFVSLANPQSGLFACAAPPEPDGTPNWVPFVRDIRNEYEWFIPVAAGADAEGRIPHGLAELAAPPLTGPAILQRMQAGVPAQQAAAFLAVAGLLQKDQARWLAAVTLMSPPALEALQAVSRGDLWAQAALPALQRSLSGGAKTGSTIRLGPELDMLASAGIDGRAVSFAHRCNALARATMAPRRSLCVLATARNEGLYLLEWVAYHRLIGAEAIYLYSNDNDDGSDDVLRILAREGLITWIENEVNPGTPAQPKAYGHALGALPDILDYRWTLIIDLDEFFGFEASRFRSAPDYIAWQETQEVDVIALSWLLFGSNGRDHWSPEPLVARFTDRTAGADQHVKSISRTNLCMHSRPHTPTLTDPGRAVIRDELGRVFAPGESLSFSARPSAELAWVAHYFFKSAEEFVWKCSRNRGDHALVKRLTPSLIGPDFARLFLWQHTLPGQTRDERMARCAPGLEKEVRRLRGLPGMEAALAEIERNYRNSLEQLRAEVAASPDFQGPEDPIASLVGRLLRPVDA